MTAAFGVVKILASASQSLKELTLSCPLNSHATSGSYPISCIAAIPQHIVPLKTHKEKADLGSHKCQF